MVSPCGLRLTGITLKSIIINVRQLEVFITGLFLARIERKGIEISES